MSTPKHTIPQWSRADRARYEALITWLDAPSWQAQEARAAYARALGNVRALEREIERDLSECGSGPEVRLSSGVSVPAGELRSTWRSLQDLAHAEENGDLLHELLRVARDPRYHTSAHTLQERGLLTHWGMREAVREIVLSSLYEIEHEEGQLTEYKLVAPTDLPSEEL